MNNFWFNILIFYTLPFPCSLFKALCHGATTNWKFYKLHVYNCEVWTASRRVAAGHQLYGCEVESIPG